MSGESDSIASPTFAAVRPPATTRGPGRDCVAALGTAPVEGRPCTPECALRPCESSTSASAASQSSRSDPTRRRPRHAHHRPHTCSRRLANRAHHGRHRIGVELDNVELRLANCASDRRRIREAEHAHALDPGTRRLEHRPSLASDRDCADHPRRWHPRSERPAPTPRAHPPAASARTPSPQRARGILRTVVSARTAASGSSDAESIEPTSTASAPQRARSSTSASDSIPLSATAMTPFGTSRSSRSGTPGIDLERLEVAAIDADDARAQLERQHQLCFRSNFDERLQCEIVCHRHQARRASLARARAR